MRTRSPVASAAAAAAVSICLAVGATAAAQDDEDAAAQSTSRVLAQEPVSPDGALTVFETVIPPGYAAPSHRHPGSLFVYVLEGSIRSRIEDEPIVLHEADDSWFEPFGVEHSFFENASDMEPARFLIMRIAPPDTPPIVDKEED